MRFVETYSTSLYGFAEVIHMFDMKRIGKNIKSIRKSSLFHTQERFAERINVSTETVSNIERGSVMISTPTLLRIAHSCNISTDFILGLSDDPSPRKKEA